MVLPKRRWIDPGISQEIAEGSLTISSGGSSTKTPSNDYDEKEAQARFEAALRGGLSTPHKPLKKKRKAKKAAKKAKKKS